MSDPDDPDEDDNPEDSPDDDTGAGEEASQGGDWAHCKSPEHDKLSDGIDRIIHARDSDRQGKTRPVGDPLMQIWRSFEEKKLHHVVAADEYLHWLDFFDKVYALWSFGKTAPLTYGNDWGFIPKSDADAEDMMERTRLFFVLMHDGAHQIHSDLKYVLDRYTALRKNPPDANLFTGQEIDHLNVLCHRYKLGDEMYEELVNRLEKLAQDILAFIYNMNFQVQQDANAGKTQGRYGSPFELRAQQY